jgi:hypothetical protein
MHTFFYGWRRKVGVVTLVMACVFMGVWIRSRVAPDTITIFARNGSLAQLISRDATIAVRFLKCELPIETYKRNADRFLVTTGDPNSRQPEKLATSIDEYTLSSVGRPYKWTLKGFGFGIHWHLRDDFQISARRENRLERCMVGRLHHRDPVHRRQIRDWTLPWPKCDRVVVRDCWITDRPAGMGLLLGPDRVLRRGIYTGLREPFRWQDRSLGKCRPRHEGKPSSAGIDCSKLT